MSEKKEALNFDMEKSKFERSVEFSALLFYFNFDKRWTEWAIYGIMELVRNLLEPRILSAQLGLPPFITLCCLYLGFTLMGVGGMLLFPLAALSVIKLQEWGYLTLWK